MKSIEKLQKKDIKKIKMIVFDVDGVLVPRGTRIKQIGNATTLETKIIDKKHIEQIKKLNQKGFLINIANIKRQKITHNLYCFRVDPFSVLYCYPDLDKIEY